MANSSEPNPVERKSGKREHSDASIASGPGWKEEAKGLMAAKKTFILTSWDFFIHHADCAAIADDFHYHYRWSPVRKQAFFEPRPVGRH